MSHIIELEIDNYRGISSFSSRFDRGIICLVGRGDSGKTSVLDAIKAVLSPQWNLAFYDEDFYALNTNSKIEIKISIADVPESLISEKKYGLYVRAIDIDSRQIKDDIGDEDIPVLTIKLVVDQSLEPKWYVVNGRQQEDKPISAGDRAKLSCFMVSDYVDTHFSWDKGNPLYTLLKSQSNKKDQEKLLLGVMREAKGKIDDIDFSHLDGVTNTIKQKAASLGLNLNEAQTTIDFREINVKEGKVSLHDGNIPFRLMGKGSKRLASIAIQTSVASQGGIALIDEIEQGLEPDRVRQIARTLKSENHGQVIITTHSRDVITEFEADDLLVLHRNKLSGKVVSEFLSLDENKLQGVIRACPEAFFARKVIVCEGATEIGICRALDSYRMSAGLDSLSFKGCAYVDGSGGSFPDRAINIADSGIAACVLCDSDVDGELSPSKDDLRGASIDIYDVDKGLSLEEQLFKDLPWEAVKDILNYVMSVHGKTEDSLGESISSRYENGKLPDDWINEDSENMRKALGLTAKKKDWFKRVDHGEVIGSIIFDCFDKLDGKRIKDILQGVISWVDK